MATAAELRARLAKHVIKNTAPSVEVHPAKEERSVPVLAPSESTETVAMAVVTDIQSTDVVVLERPEVGDSGVSDTIRGGDVQSSEAQTNLDVSNPIHQDFLQRLADLETALLLRDPLMKTHLGAIHKAMIQHEEIANLLTVEEIARIMTAQQSHTGIVLRAEIVGKSKAAATKKANQLSINDV